MHITWKVHGPPLQPKTKKHSSELGVMEEQPTEVLKVSSQSSHMGVSKNRATPQSSILWYPYFWKHPCLRINFVLHVFFFAIEERP